MKQTAKFGCRMLVALLVLAMMASVITVPAFAAENSALSALAGKDMSAFIDLLNKYNSVKDDPDAAAQLKDYVKEQYESDASFKESADEILGGKDDDDTMSKFDTVIDDVLVNDEYIGDIDTVVDAVQNGASFDEIKESIEYQKEEKEKLEKDPTYVSPTCTVTWKVDGEIVNQEKIGYKKLIPAVAGNAVAGEYIKWNNEYVIVPLGAQEIVITGHKVDVVEKVVSEVNGLPMNYGEYEMVYENGVATLFVNVDASNYKQIVLDAIGDVRGGSAAGAYKQAITAFMQASATEIYNGKINSVSVNGYEVVAIEGYGISQLVELMETVQAGNYGEIISAAGLKNAVLVDPVTPGDVANIGDDGILATYDVVLGAEGKADSEIEFRVALRGDLDLVRKGAQAIHAAVDYVVGSGADLNVEIFVPAAFTNLLTKALNHADVSDQTKKTIVAGLSECATVGELLALFDLLEYDQFVAVVEYLFDNVDATDDKEVAILEKIEKARPAFDLFKKYGNILIEKAPESINGKNASVTVKSVYNLTKMVSYEDLAALSQIKDADALVGNELFDKAAARVASKLNVSTARAQEIVSRMVEAFADYQNRIPDSAKAQAAYDYVNDAIDLIYNKIPENYKDAKLTDTYKGDGEFSFAFSATYNPGAWLKKVLDNVTITAYGRSITLGDYVPVRDITSDVSFIVHIADLYKVTFVDEKGNVVFEGFLPYGAELAPYYSDLKENGYTLVAENAYGDVLATMPAADTVVIVKKVANEYTITFDILGNKYFETFAFGEIPTLDAELYMFDTLNFNGWAGYGSTLPAVTGDATYVAEYTATITFKVADTTYTQEVAYNQLPTPDAAWTALETLTFKGWTTELAPATAHTTYEADLWATITFIVDGEVYFEGEFAYGEIPTVEDPTKTLDIENTYAFAGWTPEVVAAAAHATYVAQFDAIPHDVRIEQDGDTYKVYFGEYVNKGDRLTASVDITPILLLAQLNENAELLAVLAGDETVDGAHAITILLDNEALLNILANATEDKVIFEVSSVIGEEAEWPTSAAYGDYEAVYSFNLLGSAFNAGSAKITVPFAAANKGAYYAFVDYVGETVDPVLEGAKDLDTLTFTTSHFSYYAVKYVQYKFTVNFYAVNGDLLTTLVIDTDKGETLNAADIPAFTVTAPDASGHYVSIWNWGSKHNVDVVAQFSSNPRDYDFKETQDVVAHTYGAYEYDNDNHWCICSECGYELKEAHALDNNGDCVCGYHQDMGDTTDTTPVPGTTDTEPPVTSDPGTTETDPVTTEPPATSDPGTTETDPGSTETESETETGPVGGDKNKNGWWIFLIVLLVIIAILIVAYILYAHNIFPKGPAQEEPAQEEPEELTDAQKGETVVTEEYVEQEIVHVEHVSVAEADELMSDVQAVHMVELVTANIAASGKMGAVNVGTLNEHYEVGAKVDIESLKEKKLIDADCKRVKILADGDLDKALVVEANSFSLQAIKMITLTGGHALKLQAEGSDEADDDNDDVVAEAPAADTPAEETDAE